ncbi:MAG: hypothetical protein Q9P44_19020, partial [Anaerolineae bacterium]|nr:hypothetical protein [Anaerolineae bacterium]
YSCVLFRSPSETSTDTPVPSETSTDTPVPSETSTDTPVPSETSTDTPVPSETPTDTPIPSETPTDTPVPSETPTDTPIPGETSTDTPIPSETSTDTPVPSETSTDTPVPSETSTDTPVPSETSTDTPVPSETSTDTPVPSETSTDTPVPSETSTDTPVPSETSTDTPVPSETLTDTPIPSDTPTEEASEQAIVLPETAIPTESIVAETVPEDGEGGFSFPVEALIGISILFLVLGYIFLFWRGLVAADRYRDGFVIDDCPVCNRGGLTVEEKLGRLLGIPQTRRTVRCDVCRSVLRETGAGRWRYAVDRIENPTMYDRFNGKEITDDDLARLSTHPPRGNARPTNPEFVDEDNPDTSGD